MSTSATPQSSGTSDGGRSGSKPASSYTPRVPAMAHQTNAMRLAWTRTEFALFMEMGTGKTYCAINLAAARFQHGQIDSLLIICPNSIKRTWATEFEKFCPVDYEMVVLEAGQHIQKWARQRKPGVLSVLVVGVESLSAGGATGSVLGFMSHKKVMTVVDESSKIKNPKAIRTKRVINIGGLSAFRLILSGTPVTQGYQDLWSQFEFLHGKILDCKSYVVFRNRYCVMGGFEGRKIIGYQFTDDLLHRIKPYTFVVKKDECLDLPPQVYETVVVSPTSEQRKAMAELKALYMAESDGKQIAVTTVLERLTRYQQIIGGTFPYNAEGGGYSHVPIPGGNPKLDALMDLLEDFPHNRKVIIWARFRPEIGYIFDALNKRWPGSAVQYHGGFDASARESIANTFRDGKDCRFIVINQMTGSMGLNQLVVANYAIYYSNTFSYEERYQSESRPHRKGQTADKVTYIDIEMDVPYDQMILNAVRRKESLAKAIERGLKEGRRFI